MAENTAHYSIYTDEDLMLLLRQGKVEAFDELYARYSKRMMMYFVRMLNFNRAHAEDALQDLFIKIVEKPGAFDSSRPFKTWIFSVASNTCKNYYRHVTVVRKSEADLGRSQEIFEESFYTLASRLDAKNFRIMLDDVLSGLPAEKKEAFILRFQEDKSISEVAEIQQCPEGSVKSRLHYTLRILEDKLKMFNPVK